MKKVTVYMAGRPDSERHCYEAHGVVFTSGGGLRIAVEGGKEVGYSPAAWVMYEYESEEAGTRAGDGEAPS